MANVLVISGSKAFQVLLDRLLRRQGHSAVLASDGDEGFSAIDFSRPAVVVLDLRESDADSLLFHGLLRKRHPALPVLSLLADRLRLCDGKRDIIVEPSAADVRTGTPTLAALTRSVDEMVMTESLRLWKPAPGLA